MSWQEIKSSNVARARYTDGDMEVEFKGGSLYRYKDVPEKVFNGLLKAESVGRFLTSEIKDKFDYVKITKEQKEGKS